MIVLDALGKTWDGGASWAVRDATLDIAEGELVVLLGESGSGKTTTLKMINRLIEPDRGRLSVGGEDALAMDANQLRLGIGYAIQEIGLFPHWTIGENVGAVPRLLGWDPADVTVRVDELLALVGLEPATYRDRRPDQLSGGQQQRVGVARAIAARPRIVLMDEPFGKLDRITKDRLTTEYRRIHDDLGLTTVMVTHDVGDALLLADRIAVMKDGAVLVCDTPRALMTGTGEAYVDDLLDAPRRQGAALAALSH